MEKIFLECRYVGRREVDSSAVTLNEIFMKEKVKRECFEHRRCSVRKNNHLLTKTPSNMF